MKEKALQRVCRAFSEFAQIQRMKLKGEKLANSIRQNLLESARSPAWTQRHIAGALYKRLATLAPNCFAVCEVPVQRLRDLSPVQEAPAPVNNPSRITDSTLCACGGKCGGACRQAHPTCSAAYKPAQKPVAYDE